MKQYISKSAQETKKIAINFAKKTSYGVIALSGNLGAGKTTFVQGFAKGLGIKEKIISPTFVLIRQHKLSKSNGTLFHIDLYRLERIPDIKELGLEEIWSNSNNILLIEWAEKIEKYLPKNTTRIKIKKGADNIRLITVG